MRQKYSKRVKEALKKLDYKKVLDVYECKDFVEITVNRWGDVLTYRVYDDGRIYER